MKKIFKYIPDDKIQPIKRSRCTRKQYILLILLLLTSPIANTKFFDMQANYHDLTPTFVYLVIYFFVGIPLMMCVVLLGQYGSSGPILLWRIAPVLQGLGFTMLSYGFLKVVFSTRNVSYCVLCFADALFYPGIVMWANCTNMETRGPCIDTPTKVTAQMACCDTGEIYSGTCLRDVKFQYVSLEYFKTKIMGYLSRSSSFTPKTDCGLVLFLIWVVLHFAITTEPSFILKAVEVISKFNLGLGLTVLFSIFFTNGKSRGLIGMHLTAGSFFDATIWVEAAYIVVGDLEIISGSLFYYSAWRQWRIKISDDVLFISLVRLVVMFGISFWCFSVLGILMTRYKSYDPHCFNMNEGLMFIYAGSLEATLEFSSPQIEALLVFIFLLSQEFMYTWLLMYSIQRSIMQGYRIFRANNKYVSLILCSIGFFMSLFTVNEKCLDVQDLYRYYILKDHGGFIAILLTMGIFVIYGVENLSIDYEFALKRKIGRFWLISLYFLFPFICFTFIYMVILYWNEVISLPARGAGYSTVLIVLISITFLPIPFFAIFHYFAYAKRNNVTGMFQVAPNWGPASFKLRKQRKKFDPNTSVRYKSKLKCEHKCLRNSKDLKIEVQKLRKSRQNVFKFIKSEIID